MAPCCGGSNAKDSTLASKFSISPAVDNELRIFDAKGAEHVELFTDASDLARRQQAVQDALIAQGWKRSGEWLL